MPATFATGEPPRALGNWPPGPSTTRPSMTTMAPCAAPRGCRSRLRVDGSAMPQPLRVKKDGYGNGDGNGDGDGSGNGFGYGYGNGNGFGYGNGDGFGNGFGDGY